MNTHESLSKYILELIVKYLDSPNKNSKNILDKKIIELKVLKKEMNIFLKTNPNFNKTSRGNMEKYISQIKKILKRYDMIK